MNEKSIKQMLKAELTEARTALEAERDAYDKLSEQAVKTEAELGEVWSLLAEAHDLRQNEGYHDDDAERWSAWDRRAGALLQSIREGSPPPMRSAEEAELALERMTAERDAYKEQVITARKTLWARVWAR